MKIHYISGSTLPSSMANSVHVMKMCRALAKRGHQVTLFGKGDPHADIFAHYDVEPCFDLSLSKGKSGLKRLLHILRKSGKPDLFYGRDALALSLLAQRGVPVVFEAHQMPKTKWLGRGDIPVVAISKVLKRDLLDAFPRIPADRILVAPDGADPWPRKNYPMPAGFKAGGELNIGYTGSLHKGKGIELILDIAALMPQHSFHIVGGVKQSALPNVYFYDHVDQKTLRGFLSQFDIVLAPYQKQIHIGGSRATIERWISPMKLFEYMAAGKPIICSNLPVLREVLKHRQNAILCSPDKPESWKGAISKLQKDSVLAQSLVEEGRRQIKALYSWERRAQNILEFIKRNKI